MTPKSKLSKIVRPKMGQAKSCFDRSNDFWFSEDLQKWCGKTEKREKGREYYYKVTKKRIKKNG